MCVGSTSARQRRRVDREAVVLRRDLDLAGPLVQHRLVGAAVAELQLERLRRRAPGRAADGPGRCRRSASCRSGPSRCRWRSRPRPGRRGRSRGRCRRACARSTSSAVAVPGTTVTLQPDLRQAAEDVPLHAVVEGDDVLRRPAAPAARARRTAPKPSVPRRTPSPARPPDQVAADDARGRLRPSSPATRRRDRWSRGRRSSPRGRAAGGPAPGCRCPRCR